MRAAIFFTPAPDTTLGHLASAWLGRDAFAPNQTCRADGPRPLVADPARYGFHATLKAPFRLTEGLGLDVVARELELFCAERPRPTIRCLTVARVDAFFALVPATSEPAIAELEADVLRAFEPYRAPLDAAEIARRRPDRLSPQQLDHLYRWGYPFVLDEFSFHMTLTGPLADGAEEVRKQIDDHFADVLGRPIALDGLGLFVEPVPEAPFYVHAFHRFGSPIASHPVKAP